MAIIYHAFAIFGAYGVYVYWPQCYDAGITVYLAFTNPESLASNIPNIKQATITRFLAKFFLLSICVSIVVWNIKKAYRPLGKPVLDAETSKDKLKRNANDL